MKISQREARRLKKRVVELEAEELYRRQRWSSDWSSNWVFFDHLMVREAEFLQVKLARKLSHAVIVQHDADTPNRLNLYAEKLP